jgi:exo-1,4-beta-D-glucosaminidase
LPSPPPIAAILSAAAMHNLCVSFLLLAAFTFFSTNARVQRSLCKLKTTKHFTLNNSHSAWWLGVNRGSRTYRVYDPPATVMAVLSNQTSEEVAMRKPFYGKNLKTLLQNKTLNSLFNRSWYYTINFALGNSTGCRATLTMKGVNYRGDVQLNGKNIVPRHFEKAGLVGSVRYYDFDVSELSNINVLSVRLHRPHDWPMAPNSTDLAMPFLDWNPESPDGNLGIWRDIEVAVYPKVAVSIRYPLVRLLNLPSIELNETCQVECLFEIYNSDPIESHQGRVDLRIRWHSNEVQSETSNTFFVPPKHGKNVLLNMTVNECSKKLWWPWQMNAENTSNHKIDGYYRAVLHDLTASFVPSSSSSALKSIESDTVNEKFGLRQITKANIPVGSGFQPSPSAPNMTSAGLFYINGKRLMVRGGGFASDLFLRTRNIPISFKRHVQLVQLLGLNTIRLEGQFVDDALFQHANEYGVLIIPGLVCCDAWQHWKLWEQEQIEVAMDSVRSQIKRLRIHPSSFFFLLSSDELPPVKIERLYLNVLRKERWPNPFMNSAGSWVSSISGQSGAKMTGPYAWVPPNYWTNPVAKKSYGGASGFIAETSPGASVSVSLSKITNLIS